jgi:hypothetical protein
VVLFFRRICFLFLSSVFVFLFPNSVLLLLLCQRFEGGEGDGGAAASGCCFGANLVFFGGSHRKLVTAAVLISVVTDWVRGGSGVFGCFGFF